MISTKASGWECPKCKSIWAPAVKKCKKCAKLANESTDDSGPILLQEEWR